MNSTATTRSMVALNGDSSRGAYPRFHQLDGLRAVAAVLVVLHHCLTNSVGEFLTGHGFPRAAGFMGSVTASGVELFFVLSGVVLLRPYLRGSRTFSLPQYLFRRVQRLYPPFLAAWMLTGAVVLLASNFPTWWSAANLPNFDSRQWILQAGILNFGWRLYNEAWWSLSVEVLFYLVVPVLVAGFVLAGRSWRVYGAALAVIVGVAIWCTHVRDGNTFPLRLLSVLQFGAYGCCFLFGIILAGFDLPEWTGWLTIAVGIAQCGISTLFPAANIHIGWGLIYFGLVSLAMTEKGALPQFLGRPLFVWLGERSYSLFLTHFAVFHLANYVTSLFIGQKGVLYFAVSRLIGLPMALLTAMLVFHFVERHFARNLQTGDQFWPKIRRSAVSRELQNELVLT
jgi:peptidoglycan/LPS O-acetylase OafA/YrhL